MQWITDIFCCCRISTLIRGKQQTTQEQQQIKDNAINLEFKNSDIINGCFFVLVRRWNEGVQRIYKSGCFRVNTSQYKDRFILTKILWIHWPLIVNATNFELLFGLAKARLMLSQRRSLSLLSKHHPPPTQTFRTLPVKV